MGHLTKNHRDSADIDKVQKIREELPRRTIEQALRNASNGSDPQNPHNDPDILKVEAVIANEIFNAYFRPALRIAIGAPHYIEGPEKKLDRAAKKKTAYGDNCDWARHSNLLNGMTMAQKASDMLSERGALTIKTSEGLPLTLYIVDSDNTFIENNSEKPGLRMINTKFLIPIPLKDGQSTYHILELRSYLSASAESYERSEEEYHKYREARDLAKTFGAAASRVLDTRMNKRFTLEYQRAANEAGHHLALRTAINENDARKNGANDLLGYIPNTEKLPKGATFTSLEAYLEKYGTDSADYKTATNASRFTKAPERIPAVA